MIVNIFLIFVQLGSNVVTKGIVRTSSQSLYQKTKAPCSGNFSTVVVGSESLCLWFSAPNTETINVSLTSCASMGAHLFTVKTPDRFQYLVTRHVVTWVGLRYNSNSQQYEWDDDGSQYTDVNFLADPLLYPCVFFMRFPTNLARTGVLDMLNTSVKFKLNKSKDS
ncbi:hypothetical protein Btru_063323 [Bulinus truncatus]|nr:hypothetical protein Btru_063323 [Bulinus truncatus]